MIRVSNRWRVSGHIFYNFQLKGEAVKHECCSNNNFILSIAKMIMKIFVILFLFFIFYFWRKINNKFYLFIITLYNWEEKKMGILQIKQCLLFLLCNTSMHQSSSITSQRVDPKIYIWKLSQIKIIFSSFFFYQA